MKAMHAWSEAAVCAFLIVIACAGAPAHATVHVEGTVRAADGTPLANAYVSPTGLGQRIRTTTDAEGRFGFDLESPGGFFCWFAAPWHKTVNIPVLVPESGLRLDVRMEVVDYAGPTDTVWVIGDFNGFDTDAGAVAMTPRDDGTFVATIETDADSLRYQLLGVQADDSPDGRGGYPICGTQADRLEFDFERPLSGDHGGKYIAAVGTRDGAARIVFDPSLLPRSDAPLEVTADDAAAAGIIAAGRATDERLAAYVGFLRAQRAAGEESSEYDWSPARSQARREIDAPGGPVVRGFRLLDYFRIPSQPEDSLLARRVLDEVPPDSPAWSLLWGGPLNTWSSIARMAGDEERALRYASDGVTRHADPDVRVAFLYYGLGAAVRRGDEDTRRRLYFRLAGEYPDHWLTKMASRELAPDRLIVAGRPLPDLHLHALHGGGEITREPLAGHVFLLDFWATWCRPCVGEMKYLHEAYERFKDRGFTIVSVSFDRKPAHVDAFRGDKWPMPWLHAWARFEDLDPLAVTFEIVGIPRAILVDGNGVIVAEGAALRGEKLAPAVDAALKR